MSNHITLQVNTAGAWKNVLTFLPGRKPEVVSAVRRLAAILPDAKWCLLQADGKRDWLKPVDASQQDSMRTLNQALAIADGTVRSEVELWAHCTDDPELGAPIYDTTRVPDDGFVHDVPAELAVVERAVRYIDMRGESLPFRMVRRLDAPHLVQFVNKETQE